MCFDEVSSTSDSISKMSFVYADVLTHKIQNILQGRNNKIIKDYFLYYKRRVILNNSERNEKSILLNIAQLSPNFQSQPNLTKNLYSQNFLKFIFYFSLRRLVIASNAPKIPNPNPANPVLASVEPVFGNVFLEAFNPSLLVCSVF